jgi:hypothetical protein
MFKGVNIIKHKIKNKNPALKYKINIFYIQKYTYYINVVNIFCHSKKILGLFYIIYTKLKKA